MNELQAIWFFSEITRENGTMHELLWPALKSLFLYGHAVQVTRVYQAKEKATDVHFRSESNIVAEERGEGCVHAMEITRSS